MYPEQLVTPMREDLTIAGFNEFKTAEESGCSPGLTPGNHSGSNKLRMRVCRRSSKAWC